ncbi:MAG TPA: protein kinase [Gemmatimonadales bacterium]|nr:protein kinase [Gemmatimonadales bacterium]
MRLLRQALAPDYEIEREVGRGGMATVYLAREHKHDRQVAIKVMHSELATELGAERFLREIRIAARLSHPNILPLLASGTADSVLYYIMPFIEGDSLRARLNREGRLSIAATLRIARQVGAALTYAHAQGVVHRDVKPENIMLTGDAAVVADFGIATAIEQAGTPNLTQPGVSIGTPIYMSPEQAGGTADGRSDVYSLACVVVEMLTGQPPFTGRTALAILARHATEPLPPIATIRPEVTPAIEQALGRALSKTPPERFDTPDEFVAALESPGAARAPSPNAVDSIAVLPFSDLSRERDQEYLCEGIAEELLDALMRIGSLRVASRTSAAAFKGQQLDVREVGQRLHVRSVLEGSVRVAGDQLRISVTLTNVENGFQLWSERYDRALTDVFAVQDEIARRVVARLLPHVEGSGAPVVAPGTSDLEAYRAYLRGRHFANRRTAADLQRAIASYEAALAREPGFALAAAGLADAWFVLPVYGAVAPDEAMPQARRAAARAMTPGRENAEAQAVLGSVRAVYDWDWAGAEADFRRALSLAPGNPTVLHRYAVNCLLPLGRFAEGRDRLEEALQRDPMSLVAATTVGLLQYLEGLSQEAIATCQGVLELDPGFGLARHFLGLALLETPNPADAVPVLEAASVAAGRNAESLAALGAAYATAVDRRDDGLRLLAELEAMAGARYVSRALLAQVHLALRQPVDALAQLELARQQRAAELAWLGVRPTWAPLRPLPQFQTLLRQVGLVS